MTPQTAAVSLEALDTAIAAATGQLGEDEQRLAVAVFRLLSAGHPAPYLTMSEGLRPAAQAFTRDVSRLSCCAA